ncbi:MAG TPA: pyridoxine 5'-phosphate synthase [Phycisphaerae bacterium]|nr:pyridoxine 5'-phosphate synthase [Phycisphaerae bacterium]
MPHLSVNINKVATLRNTRALDIPSVERLARIALEAGAAGITIHPRPDRRHIRPDDVTALAALWREFPGTEFNIEGNPFIDYMPHIRAVRPTQCTLVPDTTEAFTSDHGWSLTAEEQAALRPLVREMRDLGCRVSLFMDADSPAIEAARELGAERIELYTEPYAAAFVRGGDALERSLETYAAAARRAHAAGLAVNAGHDLNLHNLPIFARRVPHVAEVSIGHALIADALEFGMAETIRKYLAACREM